MAQEGMNGVIIGSCNDKVECYVIQGEKRKLCSAGIMVVVVNGQQLELTIGTFQFTATREHSILKVHDNHYILVSDADFGIIIPLSTPQATITTLEKLLGTYTAYRQVDGRSPIDWITIDNKLAVVVPAQYTKDDDKWARWGNQLANYIHVGADIGIQLIRRTSELAGQGISKSAEFAKTKIDVKPEATKVSDATKANLQRVKVGTTMVSATTGAFVTGAIETTKQLGRTIATELADTDVGKNAMSHSGPKTEAAKNIGKELLVGTLSVVDAVYEAGVDVLKKSGSAVADIVEHRYGTDAGSVAHDAADIMGSAVDISRNVGRCGIGSIAKRTAAETSKNLLDKSPSPPAVPGEQPEAPPASEPGSVNLAPLANLAALLPSEAAAPAPTPWPPTQQPGAITNTDMLDLD